MPLMCAFRKYGRAIHATSVAGSYPSRENNESIKSQRDDMFIDMYEFV